MAGAGAISPLTVAVTGPTGTFGLALLRAFEADDRIGRVIGVARRPFDAAGHGFTKLAYEQGDVRDRNLLQRAFTGADVVVHLAFIITGTASRATVRSINVEGTINALRAAAAVGAQRFVYASSVAAYGFHPDNPVGMTERWPTRPAARLFYAREKAQIEQLLAEKAEEHPDLAPYVLRPSIVGGPEAAGAKDVLPGRLRWAGAAVRGAAHLVRRARIPVPVLTPNVRVQLVHADDVAQALLLCTVGAGPPGAYNIAGAGTVSGADVVRALGLLPIAIPAGLVESTAGALATIPQPGFLPPAAEWVEALSHPAIMDTSKAHRELGWQPRHTAHETLRATVGG